MSQFVFFYIYVFGGIVLAIKNIFKNWGMSGAGVGGGGGGLGGGGVVSSLSLSSLY